MGTATSHLTYANPVWPDYFADPFVLKVGDRYYAYGTGPADAGGREFPVLRSPDLVHWERAGHALQPPRDARGHNHWAPEVAEHDGRFYLYYSFAPRDADEHHRLRVAVADDPAGPFEDSGRILFPDAGFSIDASPFRDPRTGRWYLYFATDYTQDEPHGTGLGVAALGDDMVSVREMPRMALRATCDWQVYERDRDYKGRVWEKWHCVEGPFVVYRDGKYWMLYSGGAWHTENYGVGFAVADNPMGPWRDDFAAHGPYVLRATKEVLGPGHASVTTAPDGDSLVLVYHAWDAGKTARRMCIDPLHWTPEGPRCDGPSTRPRTL
ncbi:MAG TPA: glycoside hydrolase family 43 protein [Tepidisphaeraceae bacterium]|nr:glycoside hydrolase family 43 protein [Tepidisphaeraceae bacterium]